MKYCNVIRTTTMAFYTYIYAQKQTQRRLSLRFVSNINHHPRFFYQSYCAVTKAGKVPLFTY